MNFIKGKELSEKYYNRYVSNMLEKYFNKLKYTAGLMGPGSEILGFDTLRSTDHDWGPSVMIFLSEADYHHKKNIESCLSNNLPKTFLGFPTHFKIVNDTGTKVMAKLKKGEKLNHGVTISTIESFFQGYLGINPHKKIKTLDWLLLSEHKLRTIKDGVLFRDDLQLGVLKTKLAYYPKDVWLYLMASEWQKIAQEEPFMGRCGEIGDELGSKLIASRLIHSIMNLMFLMEKQYIPYSKWYGKAFSNLEKSTLLEPILNKILASNTWQERELLLSKAYLTLAKLHNKLEITKYIEPAINFFFDRPFKIIDADKYVAAIRSAIQHKQILNLPANIGSINQITKIVDILENNNLINKVKTLYE